MDDQRNEFGRLVLAPNCPVGFVSRDLIFVTVTPHDPQLGRFDLSLVLTLREAVELASKLLRTCGIDFEPPPPHGTGPTS